MDRQTLSHYGWIIISVIVISVIMALATPIGEIIADSAINIATKSNDMAKNTTGKGYEENVKYYQDMMKKDGGYIDPGLYEASATTDNAFQKMKKDWNSLTTIASNGPRVISNNNGVLTTNFSYTSYAENISSQILKGDLVISKDIGTIGERGFALCSGLNGVYFKSLNYIGELSFAGCSSLKWIAFESPTLKGITKNAFVDCTDLTTIYYNGTMRQFSQANIDKNQGITKTIYVICNDGKMVLNFTGSTSVSDIYPVIYTIPDGEVYYRGGTLCSDCFSYGVDGIPHQVGCKAAHNVYTLKVPTETLCSGESFPTIPQIGDIYIKGDYKYSYFSDGWHVSAMSDKSKYGNILENIAGSPIVSIKFAFNECKSLTVVPSIPSTVVDANNAFSGCVSLTDASKLPSSIENASAMFYNCTSLNNISAIPNKVKNIRAMFYNCASLKYIPQIPKSVQNANYAFYNCTALTNTPVFESGGSTSLNNAFTNSKIIKVTSLPSNVTDLYQAFYNCVDLQDVLVDINGSTTTAEEAFAKCTNLVSVKKLPNSVKNLHGTFDRCAQLTTKVQIPSSATNMLNTFYMCSSIPGITGSIPSGVSDMRWTFYRCSSFNQIITIPSGVKSLKSTFNGCHSLVYAPVFHDAITDMEETFANCSSLSANLSKLPASAQNLHGTFDRCTSITIGPAISDSATIMVSTFYLCSNLRTFNYQTIPSTVTDMSWTFYGCSNLSNRITINATPYEFRYCFYKTRASITITGSSGNLSALASTANNGNVTVQ